MDKLFQTPAVIQGINTLKDRTLKLTVYVSRELPGDQKAKLFDLEQKEGWFLFKENPVQDEEVPQEEAKSDIRQKTPTERLYNVLYVFWNQKYPIADKKQFNAWRESEMEKIIDFYKRQLN